MDSSRFSHLMKSMLRTLQSNHNYHYYRFSAVRSYTKTSLFSKISPLGSPNASVAPVLDGWIQKGKKANVAELQRIIRDLRKHNRYPQALEVSEWMSNKGVCTITPIDHAVRLDLIGKVHGLASAESYFNSLSLEDKNEKTHGALLNCYVREGLIEKSLQHMQKMKELGFASLALPYNNLMCLYTNLGQHEKVPSLFAELKENGILPDHFSYKLCITSYGMRSDLDRMEKVLEEMEHQSHITMDWNAYCAVANFYMKANCTNKAIEALRKAEEKLLTKADQEGYKHLISLYGNLGNKPEILRLWEVQKSVCKKIANRDFITVLGSLVKLGELEDAEAILKKDWESSKCVYDFRVPNVLLIVYCQKGFVEKAEAIIEDMAVKKGKTPLPSSYGMLAAAYVDKGEMDKAVECMTKGMTKVLSVAHGNEEWKPNAKIIGKILNWFGDEGDVDEAEAFVGLLNKVRPMDRRMYHALIKANIRAGRDVDGILERMKADNIVVNGETDKILSSKQELDDTAIKAVV